MARFTKIKHPWLWRVTLGSAALSLLVFVLGLWFLSAAPDHIQDQHLWSQLKDIGPAIAGSWVLCAALLAITAAGITVIASESESEKDENARIVAITRVCIAEIKTFFDRCNELDLHEKLSHHIDWLGGGVWTGSVSNRDAFRRSFGDDWFSFFRVDPEALGRLSDETSARYISLSAHARHLTSRLNWLNSCDFNGHSKEFWIDYHNDTLRVLNNLYPPTIKVLQLLGDSTIDPTNFRF